jgi:hypothetical protein
MAPSARTAGGPTRVGSSPSWVAVCGCLAVIGGIFGWSMPAPAAADSGVIYTNAPQGYSSADLGSALLQSLAEKFRFTLAGLDTDREVMQRVAAGRMRDRFWLHRGVDHYPLKILLASARVLCATERLSFSSATSSPGRQCVVDERSNGSWWQKLSSPQKNW